MAEFIKKLNIDFTKEIKKSDIEKIYNKVNDLVDVANKVLAQEVNLNQEYNDPVRKFSLEQALEASKDIRRAIGIRLRFLSVTGKYVEYSYIGTTTNVEDWLLVENWTTGPETIDGGEF